MIGSRSSVVRRLFLFILPTPHTPHPTPHTPHPTPYTPHPTPYTPHPTPHTPHPTPHFPHQCLTIKDLRQCLSFV
ncbi:MAG: hypothetical protein LW716_20805 [Microcystis sp. 53602_E8]|nr:hypothetical protein [Microcystis sp. 53602_E8]